MAKAKLYKIMVKVMGWEVPKYADKAFEMLGAVDLAENIATKGFLFQSVYVPSHRIEMIYIDETEEEE